MHGVRISPVSSGFRRATLVILLTPVPSMVVGACGGSTGGSLAVAYIGGSVAKLSSRLSPIEGIVGAVLPLIMILVNII